MHTPPIGTSSARAAGVSVTSPPGALPPTLFALSVPSTTPVPCTAVPTPPCPGGGNLKAAPGCCSSSPPRCINCGGAYTASYRDCENRPSPPTLRRFAAAEEIIPPPRAGHAMDRATDDRDLSPRASPTRSLQSVFEMATSRARRTTIRPAPVGHTQGRRSLPPAEPACPSPMSSTLSGLAH